MSKFWKKSSSEAICHPAHVPELVDLGHICALIYLEGKEQPVKASFTGHHTGFGHVTARCLLEAALHENFILADFNTYYPTSKISKVEVHECENMVDVNCPL